MRRDRIVPGVGWMILAGLLAVGCSQDERTAAEWQAEVCAEAYETTQFVVDDFRDSEAWTHTASVTQERVESLREQLRSDTGKAAFLAECEQWSVSAATCRSKAPDYAGWLACPTE